MTKQIDRILEYAWTREGVDQFVSQCYDRQALMASLIGYAREFMTHRMLMRFQGGSFRPFVLQGWPEHVDEEAKTPRLRKLELPAATTRRVKKALTEGHPLAAPASEFGLQRVLQFLGEEVTEELLCQPVIVGPRTEWVLIGKPIRIDPNSAAFSSDAITLNFWQLEEVCDLVGAQYQRIRRLGKRNKLPPKDERIPPLDRPADREAGTIEEASAFALSRDFEPVEINKRTQQRINADAGGFSAERFLAGEDAFSGKAKPSPAEESSSKLAASTPTPLENDEASEISDFYEAPDEVEQDVGVTTGVFKVNVDVRSMAEVNYGESSHSDDAPALADIENTAGIELDESVLSAAKKAYHKAIEQEEREKRHERDRSRRHEERNQRPRRKSQSGRPSDRPISAEEKANVRRAIALMDSSDREKAFKAARYVAGFGERAVKTLGRLFPGRLFVDRYQFQVGNMPPIEQHSPVLCALAELGEPALKVSRHYLDDASNDLRFYAMYLYTRLPAEDDLEHLVDRLFDRDRQTRNMAQRVIARLQGAASFEYLVLDPLRQELRRPQDEFRQSIAVEMLGRCRDIAAIDTLIDILRFRPDDRTAQLAHKALRRITLQDFSASSTTWMQWWQNQRPEYKHQWLVAALDSDSEEIRHLAWRAANALPNVELDYHPNYPRGRRRQAQQDLAVWLGVQAGV